MTLLTNTAERGIKVSVTCARSGSTGGGIKKCYVVIADIAVIRWDPGTGGTVVPKVCLDHLQVGTVTVRIVAINTLGIETPVVHLGRVTVNSHALGRVGNDRCYRSCRGTIVTVGGVISTSESAVEPERVAACHGPAVRSTTVIVTVVTGRALGAVTEARKLAACYLAGRLVLGREVVDI